MVSQSALRGYVLEELLAWLLRGSGYTLLVHESQDPEALCGAPSRARDVERRCGRSSPKPTT